MSEQAPERPAPAKRGNVFTNRIGPLPMWVWLVIVGGGILAWSFYKSKTAGSTASTSATGTPAADVPQFVNQTYVNPVAPVSTPPTTGPIIHDGGPPPKTPPPRVPPPVVQPGGGGGGGLRTERLRNRGNIMQIAKRNGIDVEDLLEANPELRKYQGTGRQVPVGTVIRVPPAST